MPQIWRTRDVWNCQTAVGREPFAFGQTEDVPLNAAAWNVSTVKRRSVNHIGCKSPYIAVTREIDLSSRELAHVFFP